MFANGMARGYMAKSMDTERFLKHVLTCVEQELAEVDQKAEVIAYVISDIAYYQVKFIGTNFGSALAVTEAEELQKKSNFGLDRKIWGDLVEAGLILHKSSHYLETVFVK